jgi:hypothetical protein
MEKEKTARGERPEAETVGAENSDPFHHCSPAAWTHMHICARICPRMHMPTITEPMEGATMKAGAQQEERAITGQSAKKENKKPGGGSHRAVAF